MVLADLIVGKFLRNLYFKQTSGLYYRTTYAIDSTEAEVLIFGSSRANHHYVPEIFEETLKLSCYNTGRDGNSILYNYAIFESVIKRYSPKLIILDIVPGDMSFSDYSYERLTSLLPYYKDHPEIRETVHLRGQFEKYKLISSIYPFNSSLITILIGTSELNKERKPDIKGYIPLYGIMQDTIPVRKSFSSDKLDKNKLQALEAIFKTCNEKGVQIVLVTSPYFAQIEMDYSQNLVSELCDKYQIDFLDYSKSDVFINSATSFVDFQHLNQEGAIMFSKITATVINQKIKRDTLDDDIVLGAWNILPEISK